MPWLDKPGATHLWAKIKAYVNSVVPKANYSKTNYSSFSGSVVSDGTVTVTKKLGMCFLNGGITLTAAVSGWVTLLDSNAVPAPQNGEAIIMPCHPGRLPLPILPDCVSLPPAGCRSLEARPMRFGLTWPIPSTKETIWRVSL